MPHYLSLVMLGATDAYCYCQWGLLNSDTFNSIIFKIYQLEYIYKVILSSVQLLSHVPTLCDLMDCSTLDFPVHHQLPELAQTHVH